MCGRQSDGSWHWGNPFADLWYAFKKLTGQ